MQALRGGGGLASSSDAPASAWRRRHQHHHHHQHHHQPPARVVTTRAKRGDVLLVAEGLSHTHDGEKQLFANLSLTVAAGDRVVVVGPNGAGKSTLLRILAGRAPHDAGQLSRNRGAKVGYLRQQDGDLGAIVIAADDTGSGRASASSSRDGGGSASSSRDDDGGSSGSGSTKKATTALEAVLSSDSAVARAVQDYARALAGAGDGSDGSSAGSSNAGGGGAITPELQRAIEAMDALNAWGVDGEARRLLRAVGLPDPNAPLAGLSGGQRRRLALAAALLGEPDLLVMDEPTNHMDAAAVDFLRDEVAARPELAVVVVSHDRAFMEAVGTRLLELDHGGLTALHPFGGRGSYDNFVRARAARRAAQASAAADARTVLRKEAEWMSRQPKARSTKAKARVDAFYELQERAADVPPQDLRVDFGRLATARLGNKALLLKEVTYAAPDGGPTILSDVSLELLPGERVGIAGANGAGKSTLLDILAGVRQPLRGLREQGETVVVGYFQQTPPAVPASLRMIDYIRDVRDKGRKRRAARPGGDGGGLEAADGGGGAAAEPPEILLERLGFPRARQFTRVEALSGGERRRLHLAAVLAAAPNVLVLDEPTNDLDLATIEVLEELLARHPGLLVVASHDELFMRGVDSLLVVGGGGVERFQGDYSAYLARERQRRAAAAAAAAQGGNGGGGAGGAGAEAAAGAPAAGSAGEASAAAAGAAAAAPSNGKAAASNGKAGGKAKAGSNGSSGSGSGGSGPSAAPPKATKKRTLGLFERQEYARLADELAQLEQRQAALSEQLLQQTAAGGGNGAAALAQVEATSVELGELAALYEQKELRYYELAEIAGDL